MSRMKNSAIVSLLLGIVFFTGCNNLDGDSSTTLISPAVVTYYPQTVNSVTFTPFVGTPYGEFAAPDLILKAEEGDCIYAQFTVSEQQSGQAYITASNVLYDKVDRQSLKFTKGIPDAIEYDYPLSDVVQSQSISPSLSPYYKGVFFLLLPFNTDKTNQISYRLSYNTAETGVENVVNLYLQAKQTTETAKKPFDVDIQAFDISTLFYEVGRDTTITNVTTPLRYVKANLKYSSKGTNEENQDQPAFINYVNNPITFYIYSN
jgi:hypothetical protein